MKLSEQAKTARDGFFINLVNEINDSIIFESLYDEKIFLFLPILLLFVVSDMSIISFIIRIVIFLLLRFFFKFELLGTAVSGTIIFIPLLDSFIDLIQYNSLMFDEKNVWIMCVIFLITIIGVVRDIYSNSKYRHYFESKAILVYQIIFLALLLKIVIDCTYRVAKYSFRDIIFVLSRINILSKLSIVLILLIILEIFVSRYLIKFSKIIQKSEAKFISKLFISILAWLSVLPIFICCFGLL